jgi:hypothetical protein
MGLFKVYIEAGAKRKRKASFEPLNGKLEFGS